MKVIENIGMLILLFLMSFAGCAVLDRLIHPNLFWLIVLDITILCLTWLPLKRRLERERKRNDLR